MPKENKSASKRNTRQSYEINDDISVSSARVPLKPSVGSKRYSPFLREVPKRDSRTEKETMCLTQAELVQPKSNGIIGSGIKYIMFPLHLLRFCIFGTSTAPLNSEEEKPQREGARKKSAEREDEQDREAKEDKNERREADAKERKERSRSSSRSRDSGCGRASTSKDREDLERKADTESKKSSSSRTKTSKKTTSDNEDSVDEMVTAAEDSDSSIGYWTPNNTMTMNMSVDYGTISKPMSYRVVEPMDISVDEHLERSCSLLKESRDVRSKDCKEDRDNSSKAQQSNAYSVDEEIAEIFQKQCTSSDDERSSSTSRSSSRRDEQNNPRIRENNNRSTIGDRTKELRDDDREQRGKSSEDFVIHKRRKVRDDVADQKKKDQKSVDRKSEERRSSRQNTPSKRRSKSSKTPVKSKDSKSKETKYKERATQTDSAFSDEDVEMTPIETPEKRSHRSSSRKSHSNLFQVEEMDQDLNYIADNEDSNDGSSRFLRKRISSGSTSSSSTDLGFDERTCTTPDVDLRLGRWQINQPDIVTTHQVVVSRAPPGFPQLPQNPPLTSCVYRRPDSFTVTTMTSEDKHLESVIGLGSVVPPAPTPMRHLYYNYPEFMDMPENAGASRILQNILKNNYYR